MKNIVRTPLYGLAMTIVNVVALILSPFSPNFLYRSRALIGELETNHLYSNERLNEDSWAVAECMGPYRNMVSTYNGIFIRDRTETVRKCMLNQFAAKQIEFRTNTRSLLNDFFLLLDPKKPYVSPAKAAPILAEPKPLPA